MIAHERLDRPAGEIACRNRCWSLIAVDDSVFVADAYRPVGEATSRAGAGVDLPPAGRFTVAANQIAEVVT